MIDYVAFTALAVGTGWSVPQAAMGRLVSLALDGMRWMTVGAPAVWDYSVKGRDLGSAPRRVQFNATLLAATAAATGGPAGTRAQELAAFGRAIDGCPTAPAPFRGHRAFWASDYAAVRSAAPGGTVYPAGRVWAATVHMHSERTVSARCVNGQGANDEHTGDGMVYTYFADTGGAEYNRAFSAWDWRRLPGITAAVDAPMLPCNYSTQLFGDSQRMNATGTASDGVAGLSAMALLSRGASARKAVALLPQGVVHLVAGAGCSRAAGDATAPSWCGEVVTTFENAVARGAVWLGCGGAVVAVPAGTVRRGFSGCRWAWHNGTGYVLPPGEVLVTNGPEPGAPAPLALFSLAASHARAAAAWAVTVPGAALADMPVVAADGGAGNGVWVVANHPEVQAVWDSRREQLLAVVWAAGAPHPVNASWSAALGVSALGCDRPCVVLIRRSSECGSFTVTASDPANRPGGGMLTVTITGTVGASVCDVLPCHCVTAGANTAVKLQLPAGYAAGRSANVTCIPHACRASRR